MPGFFGLGSSKDTSSAESVVPPPTPGAENRSAVPPTIDLTELNLDRAVGQQLPEALAKKICGVCIGQPDEHLLTLVVTDPSEVSIYDLIDIGTEHKFKVQLLGGDESQIKLAQEWIYHVSEARYNEPWTQWMATKRLESASVSLTQANSSAATEVTGQAVSAADKILKEAIAVGASDIHLECFSSGLTVRYRQDGLLRIVDEYSDMALTDAIVKRMKIMAQMDITQGRVTQGGRISIEVGGKGYDLRVSIVPVPDGESVVLRVLNKGAFSTTLADLGLQPEQLQRFKKFIAHPHGLILTCGPTGSGKSTTLYASLKSIQRPDRKILTVEDPIEYQMPGIIQVQVNTAPKEVERRVTFASALREFLRHDPDVILVGEIRDEETARISVQAALTGHLVLSTIHTNDAVGIINRLKDQNVKPYLISSTLIGGMAQRLIRRVCKACAQPVKADDEQLAILERFEIDRSGLMAGTGCEVCRGTGFKGRVGLYEVLTLTDELKELIERDATVLQLTTLARQQGMKSLLEDGLSKAAQGLVTLEEVQRVCMMDL
jgi:type II secretory ATPase GspE/PulE/Tfp pilus assembly ATPase PilB-like protein